MPHCWKPAAASSRCMLALDWLVEVKSLAPALHDVACRSSALPTPCPRSWRGDHQHLDEGFTEEVPVLDPVAGQRVVEFGDVHVAVRQPLVDLQGTPWVIGRNAVQGDQCRKIRAHGRAYPNCWSPHVHRRRLRSSKPLPLTRQARSVSSDRGRWNSSRPAAAKPAWMRAVPIPSAPHSSA